jgi:hypothetical protein
MLTINFQKQNISSLHELLELCEANLSIIICIQLLNHLFGHSKVEHLVVLEDAQHFFWLY